MTQTTLDKWEREGVDPDLIDYALALKEGLWREIPTPERNPTWRWIIREQWGQCPDTLNELDYGRYGYADHKGRGYSRDDREEPTYEQHFVEIHYHTDSDADNEL